MSPRRPHYDPRPRGLDDPDHYLNRTIDLDKAERIKRMAQSHYTRAEIAFEHNLTMPDLDGFLNRNGIVVDV